MLKDKKRWLFAPIVYIVWVSILLCTAKDTRLVVTFFGLLTFAISIIITILYNNYDRQKLLTKSLPVGSVAWLSPNLLSKWIEPNISKFNLELRVKKVDDKFLVSYIKRDKGIVSIIGTDSGKTISSALYNLDSKFRRI